MKLLIGGQRRDIAGHGHVYFIKPPVFEATTRMRIEQEEIFGSVLSVIRWTDYDAMVEQVNDVRYGLASGIYTSNLANAMKTADLLEAGNAWINQYFNLNSGAPFGGVKESGIGREHCHDTLNQYSHVKLITVQTQVNQPWFAL